jgi:hypothetical protein
MGKFGFTRLLLLGSDLAVIYYLSPYLTNLSFDLSTIQIRRTPTRNAVFMTLEIVNSRDVMNGSTAKTRLRFDGDYRIKTAPSVQRRKRGAGQANLDCGLKASSMKQLFEFANVPNTNRRTKGNTSASRKCSGHEWVPYDTSRLRCGAHVLVI